MKKQTLIGAALSFNLSLIAQDQVPAEYNAYIKQADSLYNAGAYRASADMFSKAFKVLGWKGQINDRYNAACSWALAGVPDSAFFNLLRIQDYYLAYSHICTDTDLQSLHADARWQPLVNKIKENRDKKYPNLDQALVQELDSIYINDQQFRWQMSEVEKKHGWDSKEMKALWKSANYHDSINRIKILRILDSRGWLGPEIVGDQGNSTLFLVIQHNDQKTQEKYLPMMREAVKQGKAPASSLALLEDRVLLGQGKKQIYGSQISVDKNNKYYVRPLEDPDHVDERRKAVGLKPLQEYVNTWNIKWDPEQYKKDLPGLEKK